jgi:hypothetical protein
MANIQTSLTKAVKLEAGEPFTLPPGATLIAATNAAGLESTCDLPNLEQLECYAVCMAISEDDGNQTDNLTVTVIEGIKVGATKYPFGTPISVRDELGAILAGGLLSDVMPADVSKGYIQGQIQGLSIGSIILGLCASVEHYEGYGLYYVFQTIPSIAESMSFYGWSNVGNTGSGTGSVNLPVQFPVVTRSQMLAQTDHPEAILTNCQCTPGSVVISTTQTTTSSGTTSSSSTTTTTTVGT